MTMTNNLSKKIALVQVNALLKKLQDMHFEYGEGAYHFHSGDTKRAFLAINNIDLNEDEMESLNDLTSSSMVRAGKATQEDLEAYDDKPEPDRRTPEQIRADRYKQYTVEEISAFGKEAFELMVDPDYAGKYTFDAIWNDRIHEHFDNYEGMDEDPVHILVHANIQARIEAGKNLDTYRKLREVLLRVLGNVRNMDEDDFEKICNLLDIDPDTLY